MTGAPVIRIDDLHFAYDEAPVLEDVNLHVEAGEFLGLVGPNGGGKTTLLRVILGLLDPARGRVELLGQRPRRGRKRVGYVPQVARFERDFPISVEETVLLGRLGLTSRLWGWSRSDRDAAAKALDEAGVADLRHRHLATLSGGQLQRTLIARALACEPELLLLDEPTSNVDLRAEEDIFDLLGDLNRRVTVVVVSHDLGFISRYVRRVACLNRRMVCHPTEELTGDVIAQLYGRAVRAIHHGRDLPGPGGA